jgi:GrpB-like predicted nucleotidyltransferase (UPF0157 family)
MEAEPLGLERGRVRIVPYDPRWPQLFHDIAAQVRDLLGDRIITIEHVGSTAVPGLSAKPILDILVGIADFEAARVLSTPLTQLNFEYRADEEIPDRHYFRKLAGSRRTHHLSLAEPCSRHYRNTLGFRDALRENPHLRTAYDLLKRDLAARFPADREQYLNGKTGFVLGVLASRGLLDQGGSTPHSGPMASQPGDRFPGR